MECREWGHLAASGIGKSRRVRLVRVLDQGRQHSCGWKQHWLCSGIVTCASAKQVVRFIQFNEIQ